jgi:hypothetical protein
MELRHRLNVELHVIKLAGLWKKTERPIKGIPVK